MRRSLTSSAPIVTSWAVDDPRFQKWLDHCDHIVKLVGTDHVGWGSDGYGTMIHTPLSCGRSPQASWGEATQSKISRRSWVRTISGYSKLLWVDHLDYIGDSN